MDCNVFDDCKAIRSQITRTFFCFQIMCEKHRIPAADHTYHEQQIGYYDWLWILGLGARKGRNGGTLMLMPALLRDDLYNAGCLKFFVKKWVKHVPGTSRAHQLQRSHSFAEFYLRPRVGSASYRLRVCGAQLGEGSGAHPRDVPPNQDRAVAFLGG